MKFVTSKSVSAALGVVIALSLNACGSSTTAEQPTAAPAANAEETATETSASEDIVAQYVFTNTGSAEICELYLSPVDQEDWGPDQLEEQTIPAGEKFTLTNIPAGTYDAKAVGCNEAGEITAKLDIAN